MIRAASNEPWPERTEALLSVPRSWIFQANPEIYNLAAAVAALEVSWPILIETLASWSGAQMATWSWGRGGAEGGGLPCFGGAGRNAGCVPLSR